MGIRIKSIDVKLDLRTYIVGTWPKEIVHLLEKSNEKTSKDGGFPNFEKLEDEKVFFSKS